MTAPVKPTPLHAYLIDPLERAGSTFVQQFVVMLLPFLVAGTVTIPGPTWLSVLDSSAGAAVVSLAMSILSFKVPKLSVGLDLVLRVVRTFLQSFFGVLIVSGVLPSVVHAPWQNAFATAFPVAFAALLKGLAALAAPWSEGASLIPSHYALYDHDAYVVHSLDPQGDAEFAGLDAAKASVPVNPDNLHLPEATRHPTPGKHEG